MSVEITIQSTKWAYAPGLVDFARALFREGNHDSARMMIGSCSGFTEDQIEAIASGTVVGAVNHEDETITFEFE